MSYFNYDDWKLANPDDSGFYTEETTDEIKETVFFKYLQGYKGRYSYGMITKQGYCITITDYFSIPTIETDEIEPTQTEQDDELHRIRMSYKDFTFIDRSEFMGQYHLAHGHLATIIANETRN